MTRLSSGLIIAGAYANKIRRVMFAMEKRVESKEIARAVGELNATVFPIIRDAGIDKGDVVRITIEYDIENGRIVWKWDTLEIQHYKQVPETSEKVKELLPKALEEAKAAALREEAAIEEVREEAVAVEEKPPVVPEEFLVDYLGSSEEGMEDIFTVKMKVNEEYQLAGVARVIFEEGAGKALVIIVTPEPKAYRTVLTIPYTDDPRKAADILKERITEAVRSKKLTELNPEEAKRLIKEMMQQSS